MEESYEYAMLDGLRAGFIDRGAQPPGAFTPRFLVNDPTRTSDVLSAIKQQMRTCDSFDFSVAFITSGGLQTMMEVFERLRENGKRGRILTSTYLSFNEPEIFEKLLSFDDFIETRVYQGYMHAKGYFFNRRGYATMIVGSANMTQGALLVNKEWNLLIHSFEEGDVLRNARMEFDGLWNAPETCALSREWLAAYTSAYDKNASLQSAHHPTFSPGTSPTPSPAAVIVPNDMQRDALKALSDLRESGQTKALLISATGTGKTYLAAFDVRECRPSKVLFVVHRDKILRDAKDSFERVLGDSYSYGFRTASSNDRDATCLFAMSSTLTKHLDEYPSDEFDYIVIDEAHHSVTGGHQRIIEHFKPAFMLGMTATPERPDGVDIYPVFDNNIAYKIGLKDALDNGMLVPFHYFGIKDLYLGEEEQEDMRLFARLTSDQRVSHIIKQIETYSVSRRGRRGLVFCSRKDEACELSKRFNAKGYKTIAMTGDNADSEREEAIRLLENSGGEGDYIEYIFTVDIFNEGVDIPSLNQIVMLRPTESAIVFVQQLGRGLRRCSRPAKDYTLVLDFIGNYQKNFLIPVALSGDRTYNKDGLRVFVKEGSSILPGASTVSFDSVSEKRVLRSIDGGSFGTIAQLKEGYGELRHELGRIPTLADFDRFGGIDPLLIFDKTGSYHGFLKRYDPDYTVSFSKPQERVLAFISQKIAAGERPHELLILQELIEGSCTRSRVGQRIEALTGNTVRDSSIASACRVLTNRFPEKSRQAGNADCVFLVDHDDVIDIDSRFARMLENEEFRRQILEVLRFGLDRFARDYTATDNDSSFCIGKKYTYEDVCRLLDWPHNINGQNIGGYKYDETTNTFPVFINYEKGEDVADSIRYEDRFVSPSELVAISKQPRHLSSPEIQRLKAMPGNGMTVYLFVRKNKDDAGSKEFYFLGEMEPAGTDDDYREFTMPNTESSAVEIRYRLKTPVPQALFDYLTTPLSEDLDA